MDGGDVMQLPSILQEPLSVAVQPGLTLAELMTEAAVPEEIWPRVVIRLNGALAPRDWSHIVLRDGDQLDLFVVPTGGDGQGKAILSAVATIAISLAAPLAATAIVGAAAATAGTVGFYALTAGITLVGTLLVSALIPPPTFGNVSVPSSSTPESEAQTFRITGQSNETRLYGQVPRVYGRVRVYPLLMNTPRLDSVGVTSRVTALYDFGIGDLDLTDIRAGALPVDYLEPNLVLQRNSLGRSLRLTHRETSYDSLDFKLEQNEPLVLRTRDLSVTASVDVYFPSGLAILNRNGDRSQHTVGFKVRYRRQGSGDPWLEAPPAWFSGATVGNVNWLFEARYDADLEGKLDNAWRVMSYQRDDETYHRRDIGKDDRLVKSDTRRGTPWDGPNDVEVTLDGRRLRRGTLRDTGQLTGGPRNNNVQIYELLVGTPAPDNVVLVSNSTAVPFVLNIRFSFPEADLWEIEIVRTTPVTEATDNINSLRDLAVVTLLQSHRAGAVLNLKRRHTFLEMAFTASEKVSGVVENLSAIATSYLREITPTGFGPSRLSSNPAEAALDLLTGESAKRPLRVDQIDFPSWARLAAICDEVVTQTVNGVTYTSARYEFNGVVESVTTMKQAVNGILSVARAQVTLSPSGKVGVLIDNERPAYRQLITPANSWNFTGRRSFTALPHALRVAFLDEEADWAQREVMVYRDGFSEGNTTLIEDLQTWGITSFPEAWRYGRYMLAQGILRSETFTVEMDAENLAVARGDLVGVQHDTPRFGGMSMRVLAVSGQNVTLDRPLELASGSYAVRRSSDGTIRQGRVLSQIDETTWVFDNASDLQPDDLVALGTGASAIQPYIVSAIEPGTELTARVSMVRYDPRVYTADSGPLPPYDPGFGRDPLGQTQLVLEITSVETSAVTINRVPHQRFSLRWDLTRAKEVYDTATLQFRVQNSVIRTAEPPPEARLRFDIDIPWYEAAWFGSTVEILVTPISTLGYEGTPDLVSVPVPALQLTPEAPPNAFLDVRGQELTLFWDPSPTLSTVAYEVRYTPETGDVAWSASAPLARVAWEATSVTFPARTGTYLLRAVGVDGSLSDVVTLRTTIEELPDLNAVATVDEAGTWPGSLIRMTRGFTSQTDGTNVRLLNGTTQLATMPGLADWFVQTLTGDPVFVGIGFAIPSSVLVSAVEWPRDRSGVCYYQFAGTIDLGQVYESRIQDHLLVAVVDRSGAAPVAGAFPFGKGARDVSPVADAGWNTWLEYRAATTVGFISEWDNLANLPSMALPGAAFSEWRKLTAGDVTARLLQFRFAATADDPDLLILLRGGIVLVDMPDRQWRGMNIDVGVGGAEILFDPAFRDRPVVAVTIEGATVATGYEIDTLDRTRVVLRLVDGAGAPVAGRVDVAALGYGRERAGAI
jgi:hypothetical protein